MQVPKENMKKPSVTQLLDLLAKPALISWANKQGLLGIDIAQSRKRILANGTSLHSQAEHGVFDKESDAINFNVFMRDKSIIAQEQNIETHWFVGRYDAKIQYGNDTFIVDYKTGFKGKLYLEHKLQLVAYTMAEPASMAIVGIPQFQLFEVQVEDRVPYEQMLINLSILWNLKNDISRL